MSDVEDLVDILIERLKRVPPYTTMNVALFIDTLEQVQNEIRELEHDRYMDDDE